MGPTAELVLLTGGLWHRSRLGVTRKKLQMLGVKRHGSRVLGTAADQRANQGSRSTGHLEADVVLVEFLFPEKGTEGVDVKGAMSWEPNNLIASCQRGPGLL